MPGFAALPRQPAHIRVTKDGTEVDSVPVSDKALLFGRKVTAPPTSRLALAVTTMCWHTHTHTHTHMAAGEARAQAGHLSPRPHVGLARARTARR